MSSFSTAVLLLLIIFLGAILPAIAFAAQGEEEKNAWVWEEDLPESPSYSTGLVVGAQALGYLGSSTAMVLIAWGGSTLINRGGFEYTNLLFDTLWLISMAVLTPLAISWTVNEVGDIMGRGSHYPPTLVGFLMGWLVAGAAFSITYAITQSESLVLGLPFFLLPMGTAIGGYHWGHRRSLERPSAGLNLQPLMAAPEWGSAPRLAGATLNLGLSF